MKEPDGDLTGAHEIWACLCCARCSERCPVEIDFPEFIRSFRHQARSKGNMPLESARAVLGILNKIGITPVISNDDRCCGHDALWSGNEKIFRKLAERNMEVIRGSGAKTVLFTVKTHWPRKHSLVGEAFSPASGGNHRGWSQIPALAGDAALTGGFSSSGVALRHDSLVVRRGTPPSRNIIPDTSGNSPLKGS